MPSSSETCGRVAWKSKKFSGSTSAKRSAPHVLARYPAASEAACAPSFQPRKAATRIGLVSSGRWSMRSSSATRSVYVRLCRKSRGRTPQNGDEGHEQRPHRRREADVDEHER